MPPSHTSTPPSTPKGCRHRHFRSPRSRKKPSSARLQGLKEDLETPATIKEKVAKRLRLTFSIEDWQAHLIHRVRAGYDSIFLAGTGYGKSIVFQGLCAMDKSKIVIVISPLKALERDQVEEAERKHLRATMINETTAKDPSVWEKLRKTKDHLYYVSPEMALGDSFVKIWQDAKFRSKVQAVVVDEAHCIAEWGDGFRPEYGKLAKLRDYIGHDIPMVACTATCSTDTFDVIWKSLSFGHRPFWGIDVGCDRANLLFLTRTLQNSKNPVLDILNILPDKIADDAPATVIPKSIFYFESYKECRDAVETLRKTLPPHLRDTVQSFKGFTSEEGKKRLWKLFREGKIRVLCATDAAGMGCNIPDIEFVALFSAPRSFSTLVQRWGRAARDRASKGTCFLFLPKWAFRPGGEQMAGVGKGKKKLVEPRTHTTQRGRMERALEEFVNLGHESVQAGCAHAYLRDHFQPDTKLDIFKSLAHQSVRPTELGSRSQKATYALSWTKLEQAPDRLSPRVRCCNWCTPSLIDPFLPPASNDPRLTAYADNFLFPLDTSASTQSLSQGASVFGRPHSKSVSSSSSRSSACTSSSQGAIALPMSQTVFVPLRHKFKVPDDERERLEELLDEWRKSRRAQRLGASGLSLLSFRVDLPDKLLKRLAAHGGDFLRIDTVDPSLIRKIISWDLASPADLESISHLITSWRIDAAAAIGTPQSHGGKRKKRKAQLLATAADTTPRPSHISTPIFQPPFSPARMSQPPRQAQPQSASLRTPQSNVVGITHGRADDVFGPIVYSNVEPSISRERQQAVLSMPAAPSISLNAMSRAGPSRIASQAVFLPPRMSQDPHQAQNGSAAPMRQSIHAEHVHVTGDYNEIFYSTKHHSNQHGLVHEVDAVVQTTPSFSSQLPSSSSVESWPTTMPYLPLYSTSQPPAPQPYKPHEMEIPATSSPAYSTSSSQYAQAGYYGQRAPARDIQARWQMTSPSLMNAAYSAPSLQSAHAMYSGQRAPARDIEACWQMTSPPGVNPAYSAPALQSAHAMYYGQRAPARDIEAHWQMTSPPGANPAHSAASLPPSQQHMWTHNPYPSPYPAHSQSSSHGNYGQHYNMGGLGGRHS